MLLYASLPQEWMEDHALPMAVEESGLLSATTYAVAPTPEALEQKGISYTMALALEAAFFVTKEMLQSLSAYLAALEAAGFEPNKIGLDIDGKRKLVRNGWDLITFGGR